METAPQTGQKILHPEARAQPTEGATSKRQHFYNQKDANEKNIQKELNHRICIHIHFLYVMIIIVLYNNQNLTKNLVIINN